MPRRRREKSVFEAGLEYGKWLADQADPPEKRKRRQKSRQKNSSDPFSILFEWSSKKKLEKRAQEQQAIIAARQHELDSAWQRAMVEFFPDHDASTFPTSPRSISAKRLEHLAEHIYAKLGYQVERTGGAGDGGVDVWLDKFGEKEIVQCKQYQNPVQPDTIREVYGALGRRARKAYMWAPGGFTSAAQEEAKRFNRIELLDEQGILQLVENAYPPMPGPELPTPEIDSQPRRYLGMTERQIFILVVMAFSTSCILCFLANTISTTIQR